MRVLVRLQRVYVGVQVHVSVWLKYIMKCFIRITSLRGAFSLGIGLPVG